MILCSLWFYLRTFCWSFCKWEALWTSAFHNSVNQVMTHEENNPSGFSPCSHSIGIGGMTVLAQEKVSNLCYIINYNTMWSRIIYIICCDYSKFYMFMMWFIFIRAMVKNTCSYLFGMCCLLEFWSVKIKFIRERVIYKHLNWVHYWLGCYGATAHNLMLVASCLVDLVLEDKAGSCTCHLLDCVVALVLPLASC